MEFTVVIADKYAVLPFEILKQDKDDVIMLINYYILKGDEPAQPLPVKPTRKHDDFWNF